MVAQIAMLRECWTQVLLAQPMGDTAIPDSKELLWELAVLAQSFCKGRGIMESALDWHIAQLKVSLVLGIMSLAGRLKARCAHFLWLLIHKHASAVAVCILTGGVHHLK